MKAPLIILIIALVVCTSLGIENSNERSSIEYRTQDNVASGDGENFQYDQDTERNLERKKKGRKSSSKKSSSNKSSSNKSSSKKSSYERFPAKKYSHESYPHKKILPKSDEDRHEVFIQSVACPGKCLTIGESALFPDDFVVTKEECDNCDPNQKWRINTYKGNLVQIEHVNTGLCACVAQEAPRGNPDGVCGDALKLGPCEHYGKITDRSIFSFQGGQFYSQFCWEGGFPSLLSTNYEIGPTDYCGISTDVDNGFGELYPIFLFPTTANEGEFTYVYSLFMVTECLLVQDPCHYDWW